MNIDVKFQIGEIVYALTDNEQLPRVITGYVIRPANHIIYYANCGTDEDMFYDIELTNELNILAKI